MRRFELTRYLSVAVQAALLLLVLREFEIEGTVFHEEVALVTLAGFLINDLLPSRFRLPFFFALSLTAIGVVFGVSAGAWLVAIGLGLIGICHLPIPFYARVPILIVAGVGLCFLRSGRFEAPWPSAIWPILGSIFMFRLIIYMYDLRHEKGEVGIWKRLSYFFLLPNVCFPLFPVIDFKRFGSTYYNEDPYHIYQRGLVMMARGTIHLILYRGIYQFATLFPAEVVDLGSLGQFVLSNFLLYLRISGQFHLIVGMLCLFGFNLPDTNYLYYFASSFTDYWRRINIYWKDFMLKIFYYPTYFALRRFASSTRIVLATAFVFVCTWFLHSYQWFWLRGSFPILKRDMMFWGLLGLFVVVNSIWETRHKRRRTLGAPQWSFPEAARLACQTVGTFLVLSILWSFWTSPSGKEWIAMWSFVGEPGWTRGGIWLVAVPLAGLVALILGEYLSSRGLSFRLGSGSSTARSGVLTTAIAVLLLVVGNPAFHQLLGPKALELAEVVTASRLSRRDIALMNRGYYEGLLGVDRFNTELWEVYMKKPNYWRDMWESDASRETGDYLVRELVPLIEMPFKGATLRTNRWGMRDQDYAKSKSPGSYRIAMLGASHAMGAGVENGETFEAVLERRLESDYRESRYERFEILNFAVAGYSPIERMMTLEQKALGFAPDALLYIASENDNETALLHLAERARKGIEPPYPFLAEIAASTGIDADTTEVVAERRLGEVGTRITSWVYRRLVEICDREGIVPVWVFRPNPEETFIADEVAELMQLAEEAGFVVMDLRGAFDGHDERLLWLAEWDRHTNAKGHELLADRLLDQIVDNQEEFGLRFLPQ
jgi:hypothetical protein